MGLIAALAAGWTPARPAADALHPWRPARLGAQEAPQLSPAPWPAGTLRTDTLWSPALGVTKTLLVYLPPSYAAGGRRRYPVLLYLHGLGGNERNWSAAGRLPRVMDSLAAAGLPEAIVAMPDGDDSWYTTHARLPDPAGCQADSARREPAATYCVNWLRYDDYVAHDVVRHVDARYRTRPDAAHRGIGGLSMGGYGAIALALAYPDRFSAAASHSGVLAPRLLPAAAPPRDGATMDELREAAGALWRSQRQAFGGDTIAWRARDPAILARRAVAAGTLATGAVPPALFADVGADDRWLPHNRAFRDALARLGVPLRYAEWPGGHTWDYWRAHLPESLAFLLARVAP
ncbi:MAG: esterase family protein [Gemmatimonadetes bacterium]|nr:esterase family protein [Gemmatimonadota bacterium]